MSFGGWRWVPRAVGVSGHFLAILEAEGVDALIAVIGTWITRIRQLMMLLGAETVRALADTDVLLTGALAETCRLRGIDPATYARRSVQAAPDFITSE
ncbi:hypothetical protein ACQPXH_08935 [Nocardia sp. CA-135953]|uniref:hypothetical protein n=1 Tax=Nocardia sp. CA-135953 TaxID=3239978 RepID=UPI003D9652A4